MVRDMEILKRHLVCMLSVLTLEFKKKKVGLSTSLAENNILFIRKLFDLMKPQFLHMYEGTNTNTIAYGVKVRFK